MDHYGRLCLLLGSGECLVSNKQIQSVCARVQRLSRVESAQIANSTSQQANGTSGSVADLFDTCALSGVRLPFDESGAPLGGKEDS